MSKIFKAKDHIPKKIKAPIRGLRIKGDPSSKGKSETQIEKEICSWLQWTQTLFWRIKIKGDPTLTSRGIVFKKNANVGFSDILVCYKGLMVCLEVKKCGGLASEEQLETQRRVRNSGGFYEFVTSLEEVKTVFIKLHHCDPQLAEALLILKPPPPKYDIETSSTGTSITIKKEYKSC